MLGRLPGSTGGGLSWLDHTIFAGLVLILAFAPFAFGAVHQWAYTLMEMGQFGLLTAWMLRIRLEGIKPARNAIAHRDLLGLLLPVVLFALLLVLQITPLPPSVMRVISPSTYQLYAKSFPGWPKTAPYHAFRGAWTSNQLPTAPDLHMALPPVGGQRQARAHAAAPAPKAHPASVEIQVPTKLGRFGDLRWRSIAIAPSVTWSGLIGMLGSSALFFLVLGYPYGLIGAERDANARFMRQLVLAMLAVGSAVAFIGLVEKATWNGRILWFFIPHDWVVATPANVRASGPFVNPDHFANFLEMILPVAVVGTIFPIAPGHREHATDLRMPCAVAAFLLAAGITLSLSRGAWISSIAGICVALSLSFNHARERAPVMLQNMSARALPAALAGLVAFLLVLLFLIGPAARNEATSRVGSTIAQGDSLGVKPLAWLDSLRMIRDFPVFGVGLGCWAELFPHYQRPPWMPFYFRQPENDYIQFVAETGAVGVAVALLFWLTVWRKCRAAMKRLSARQWPLFAGLLGGLTGALIHEFFDFSLHTPANALLFIILLAALLRLGLTHLTEQSAHGLRTVSTPSKLTYIGAAGIAAGAVALIFAAHYQHNSAYPYDIGTPKNFAQAETATINHPADSGIHLALVALMPPGAPAMLRNQQLGAAVWLNPNDPLARDVYARSLLLDGKKSQGLAEISRSVLNSPDLESHFYLQKRVIPWLLPEEQKAVEDGFSRAIKAGHDGSARDFGQFYRGLGRHLEAAQVEEKAADSAADDDVKFGYLVDAGKDFAMAGEMKKAQEKLRAAIEIDPTDVRPYRELMVGVMAPQHDMKGAKEIAQEAIAADADQITVEQAMADAALKAGDFEVAETALIQVSKDAPSYTSMMNLGTFYTDTRKYDRATIAYQHAIEIDPNSAQAYFKLAEAEEATFDFAGANRDYAHAIKLSPDSDSMQQAYREFQQRVAQARKLAPGG